MKTMTYNFCTLFDKNYIFRGLAMYYSLKEHCLDFKLWILCMDDVVFNQLAKMNLESIGLIKLSDLEDEELSKIKSGRTIAEYCWTLSSSLPLYIFKNNPELELVVYLDSDLYFYSSPNSIFEEMGDSSILIVRHNYSKELAYLEERSGIYNVCLFVIKNNEVGIKCLKWWRERCLEWCFSRLEEGKFGDQMYLNDWPTRFEGVKIVKSKGVNLAPWNLNKYNLTNSGNQIFVDEDELVFYHFHSLKIFGYNNFLRYQNFYLIRSEDEKLVYPPYLKSLNEIFLDFSRNYPEYGYGFDKKGNFRNRIKYWLKKKLFIFFYLKSLLK